MNAVVKFKNGSEIHFSNIDNPDKLVGLFCPGCSNFIPEDIEVIEVYGHTFHTEDCARDYRHRQLGEL